MSITPDSAVFFATELDRNGSIVLEIPVVAGRFKGVEANEMMDFCVAACEDGSYTVLVPQHIGSDHSTLSQAFSSPQIIETWRPLALPRSNNSLEAIQQVVTLSSGSEDEIANLSRTHYMASSRINEENGSEGRISATSRSYEVVRVPAVSAANAANFPAVPFTKNLSLLAQQDELLPVYGRANETEQLITILCQAGRSSALLCGEPGVGKTAIVEKLALLTMETHSLPPKLRDCLIYELDAPALLAASSYKGALEKNVGQLLSCLTANPRAILFADEIHGLTEVRGDLPFTEMLKPPLARGLRVIGATTHAEYKSKILPNAALCRRFDLINVAEPDKSETLAILRSRLPSLQAHHGVDVEAPLLEKVVTLADEYFPERHYPDKALTLLDRAMAAEAIKASRNSEQAPSSQNQ